MSQIIRRIILLLPKLRVSRKPAPELCSVVRWIPPLENTRVLTGPEEFRLLNETRTIRVPEDWDRPDWPRLWRYHLHYFDDLNAQCDADLQQWHCSLIDRWIRENPVSWGTGWEPYPISRRIVNWIKWDLRTGKLNQAARNSLVVQSRWLERRLENHLLGNHLLANAKALVFAGLYFEGEEAGKWLKKGETILRREIPEQILSDGGHFERSPMYHQIVLEDFLDLHNAYQAYDRVPVEGITECISEMIDWAEIMNHTDGEIAFFNDAAISIAPPLANLVAYAKRLGLVPAQSGRKNGSRWLKASGYIRLEAGPLCMLFDAAPVGPDYLPGHAHADTLSLELSIHGHRVLVNSGTSVYEIGPERQRQRGTAAHNTVEIDAVDSSEVWAGFRVARRARVHDVQVDIPKGEAVASHNGYTRLPGRPVHRRRVCVHNEGLIVDDEIRGAGTHQVRCFWHLHPDVRVVDSENPRDGVELEISSSRGTHAVSLRFQGADSVVLEPATYHPEFGKAVNSYRLVLTRWQLLSVGFRTILTVL